MEPLILPGTMDSLEAIGAYVREAAAMAGLSKEAAYKLRLAVDEMATNSVMHGYDEAGLKGELRVSAEMTEGAIMITLEDSGPAFDPRGVRLPGEKDLAAALDGRAVGGLGIFLTLKSVDEFGYQRVGDHNRSTFLMRRVQTEKGGAAR